MDALLKQVMDDIDSLAAPKGMTPDSTTQLSDGEIASRVSRLQALLETDLGAAQATLAELRSGVADSLLQTLIRDVAEKIDLFEIDEALALLNDLNTQLVGRT